MKLGDRRASLGQEAMKMLQVGCRGVEQQQGREKGGKGGESRKCGENREKAACEISLEGPQRCPQLSVPLLQM